MEKEEWGYSVHNEDNPLTKDNIVDVMKSIDLGTPDKPVYLNLGNFLDVMGQVDKEIVQPVIDEREDGREELVNFKRKIGHFTIAEALLDEAPDDMQSIMAEVIVVHCESLYYERAFRYTAISKHFSEIPLGYKIPEYEIITEKKDEEISVSFKRKE